MRALLVACALVLAGNGMLPAQSVAPAQPADPAQARPAVPVGSDALTPVMAAPAHGPTSSAASTNSAAGLAVPPVSVLAESSLKAVLQELAQAWADSQDNALQVPLTLTNSGTILSKAQAGGYDVVISASVDDVKTLTDRSVLFADGQRSLARNTVVVYGRRALVKDEELEWFDLIGSEWKKVALGRADQVTSGRVAQRALQKHGLLDDEHKDVFTYAMTDGLALAVVQRDQADAVFAFKTDVARLNLTGFDVYPISTDDAPPVFYTAAVCRLAKNPDAARAFVTYCGSDAAKPVWAKYGFETN
jgi:molybdate transport system substrate-binding protein